MIALVLVLLQDSLTVHEAVRRALATHPALTVAEAQADRAGAELGEAGAGRLPRLQLDGAANRFQEPMVVLPLHGFNPQNPPAFDRTLFQAGLTVHYTVFDFGARGSRLRAARALQHAAAAGLSAAQLSLIARTTRAYLAVLTARGVLAAQDQRLAALEAETRRVRQLLAEGRAARVDLLRVEAERARAAAERIAVRGQLDVAETELVQLAGRSGPLVPVALSDTALPHRDALRSRARESSPELLESRRRAEAAEAARGTARAAWLPELRLTGAWIDRGSAAGDFAAEWQAGLSLAYPLFTGGQRGSAVRKAEADARAARGHARLVELAVDLGLDRALAAAHETQARAAALSTAAEQSEEVARIERLALEVGSGTQTDYLEAEATLLRARAALIEARHAEIAARVELARLLGELTPAWLERNLVRNPASQP
jgi:outer membrane protein TolC